MEKEFLPLLAFFVVHIEFYRFFDTTEFRVVDIVESDDFFQVLFVCQEIGKFIVYFVAVLFLKDDST